MQSQSAAVYLIYTNRVTLGKQKTLINEKLAELLLVAVVVVEVFIKKLVTTDVWLYNKKQSKIS